MFIVEPLLLAINLLFSTSKITKNLRKRLPPHFTSVFVWFSRYTNTRTTIVHWSREPIDLAYDIMIGTYRISIET